MCSLNMIDVPIKFEIIFIPTNMMKSFLTFGKIVQVATLPCYSQLHNNIVDPLSWNTDNSAVELPAR